MFSSPRGIPGLTIRSNSTPPPFLRFRSSNVFIITVICFACFTDIFLYGIIVPVIPFALLTRIDVPENDVQHWVSNLFAVYAAALIVCSPICGWLADHYKSRRVPYLSGLLAMAGATIMLCIGDSITLLVIGRLLQGASAAVVSTVGLALLVDTVGQKDIGQAAGWVSLSMSIAILIAPLLGGIVYAKSGYYAVYYMGFALIAVDILLRLLMIEKKHASKWATAEDPSHEANEISPVRQGPSTGAIEHVRAMEYGTPPSSQARNKRFHLPPVLFLLASGRLLSAAWCVFAQSAILTSWDAVLPLRVANVFAWTSLGAGLIFLPLTIPSFVAPAIGIYSDKRGPRLPVFLGFVIGTPALVLLRLVSHSGIRQIVLLCVLLTVFGVAYSFVITPLLAEFTYAVDAEEKKRGEGCFGDGGAYAQAYGLFMTAFAGGMLVGPLWGGLIELRAGWGTMTWTLGLLSAVSAVPAGLITGGYLWKMKEKKEAEDEEYNIARTNAGEKSDKKTQG
jgi:MFS family permease